MSSHANRQAEAVARAAELGHVVVIHPHDAGPRVAMMARHANVKVVKSDKVQRGQAYVFPPEQAKEWK